MRFGVGPCETVTARKKGGHKPKPLLYVQNPKTQKWVRDVNEILQHMLKVHPGFHWSSFEIAELSEHGKTLDDASGEALTIVMDRDQSMSRRPDMNVKKGAVPTLDVGGASFGHARSLPHVMKDPRRRRRIVIRVFSI